MGLVWSKAVEGEKMEPTRFVEVTLVLMMMMTSATMTTTMITIVMDITNLKVTSSAAAKMLNIFPRKGCIAEVIPNDDDDLDYDDEDDDDEDDDDGDDEANDRKGCITEVIHNHDDDFPKEEQHHSSQHPGLEP